MPMLGWNFCGGHSSLRKGKRLVDKAEEDSSSNEMRRAWETKHSRPATKAAFA